MLKYFSKEFGEVFMETLTVNNKSFGLLNANTLRLIACILMLMDHAWATVIPGSDWLTYAGRMAFPIFAFQIAEGFFHTSDFKKYARRLFIFALISEIPFNLMYASSIIYPFHQNVMFTLLLGLLAIKSLDNIRIACSGRSLRIWNSSQVKAFILGIIKAALCVLAAGIGFTDYSITGVLTIILFYLCRGFRLAPLIQLAAMVYINCFAIMGRTIPLTLGSISFDFPTQGFAVLSLIFIWLYNGKKGHSSKVLQYSFYAFYPVHMLILAMIVAAM